MYPGLGFVVRVARAVRAFAIRVASDRSNGWVRGAFYAVAGIGVGVALWVASFWLARVPATGLDAGALACAAIGALHGFLVGFFRPIVVKDILTCSIGGLGLLLSWAFLITATRLALWETVKGQYKGLGELPNWYLYPVWFVIVTWAARLTWHPFVASWKGMPRRGLVIRAPRADASELPYWDRRRPLGPADGMSRDVSPAEHWRSATMDENERRKLEESFQMRARRWRWGIGLCAMVAACGLMWFDNYPQWGVYNEEDVPAFAACVVGCPKTFSKANDCRCQGPYDVDCTAPASTSCETKDLTTSLEPRRHSSISWAQRLSPISRRHSCSIRSRTVS